MNHRRILVGALLSAGALAALPTAANAAATCSYDQAKRTMTVTYGAADTGVTLTNSSSLQFSEDGGFQRSCFSVNSVRATTANTDLIKVRGGSNIAAKQTTTIDQRNGYFLDGNPNLKFQVLTGSGGDRLIVRDGSRDDSVHLRDQTGTLAIGPAVDLNGNGSVDVFMTTGFDSVVQVNGGAGSDFLDATGSTVFQVVLLGENDADTLVGGARQDSLDGGRGNDKLFARDGQVDTVNGGLDGFDQARIDQGVDHPINIDANL